MLTRLAGEVVARRRENDAHRPHTRIAPVPEAADTDEEADQRHSREREPKKPWVTGQHPPTGASPHTHLQRLTAISEETTP